MKLSIIKVSVIAMFFIISLMLQSFSNFESNSVAKIAWMSLEFDFGSVDQGVPVSHEFAFTNEGDAPLLINDVKASCGCTVPIYPKSPINPGESEIIKVTYNSAKKGVFKKTVKVFSNASTQVYELTISGEVLSKK